MAKANTPLRQRLTKRRQLRMLENEKDKHLESKAIAEEGIARVKEHMQLLRGKKVPGNGS